MTDMNLLILPTDPEQAAVNLRLGATGEILARSELVPGQARPAVDRACLLAVPAALIGLHRLRLVASSSAQAAAAGSRMVEGRLAVAREQLHVAVSEKDASDERWIAVVSPEHMRSWLGRAQALGFKPESMVPDCLLLAAPEHEDFTVLASAAAWRVRGHALAFSAEPALAQALLAGKTLARIESSDQMERALALGAVRTPLAIDLLQNAFSRRPAPAVGWTAWRRVAALAAAVLLLPLLGWTAQAMRHELGENAIESRSSAALAAVSDQEASDSSAFVRARSELARLRARDAFAITSDALFASLSAIPDASVRVMDFGEDGVLAITLAHPGAGDVASLRELLAARGIDVAELSSTQREGSMQSELLLSLSP